MNFAKKKVDFSDKFSFSCLAITNFLQAKRRFQTKLNLSRHAIKFSEKNLSSRIEKSLDFSKTCGFLSFKLNVALSPCNQNFLPPNLKPREDRRSEPIRVAFSAFKLNVGLTPRNQNFLPPKNNFQTNLNLSRPAIKFSEKNLSSRQKSR